MRMALCCWMVFLTSGCGGIHFSRYNMWEDDSGKPFVARPLVVQSRDYHTGEPLEGVAVERTIVMGEPFSLEAEHITLGTDYTSPSGHAVIAIDQPGTIVNLTKREYCTEAFFPSNGVYVNHRSMLTEHYGEIVVPMKPLSDVAKPTPPHAGWLSDEYKLPQDWAEKRKRRKDN